MLTEPVLFLHSENMITLDNVDSAVTINRMYNSMKLCVKCMRMTVEFMSPKRLVSTAFSTCI